MKKLGLIILFFSLKVSSFAQELRFPFSPEAGASASPVSSAVVSIGYVIQLFFSLLVVLGFLYVIAKYLLPKMKFSSKSEHIIIFDKLVAEPQVTLYIVKAAKKSWLISVSNKNVTLIDKFEEGTF
ncbi:MAG: hypothetical protein WC527_02230 [Candidatus Margulisiibacteriota bacterium]